MTGSSPQRDTDLTLLDAKNRRFAPPQVICDGLWSSLINFGSKASILVQLAIAARAGGPTGLGAFSLLLAAAVLISSLCDFGFSTEVTRYASAVGCRTDLRAVWLRLMRRMMAAAALTATAVTFFGIHQGDLSLLAIVSASMYSSSCIAVTVGVAIANGIGLFRFTGTALGTARLCSVPLSFLALLVDSPNSTLIASSAICEAAAAYFIWHRVRRTTASSYKPISVQKFDHTRALHFGAASFMNMLINKGDTLLLGSVLPLAALGAYATASQVENAVATVALVPASALMVHIARASQSGDHSASRRALRSAAIVVALLSFGMAVVLATAAFFWIPIVFGEEMTPSIVPVRIVLAGATFNCLAGVTLMALSGLGRSRSVLMVWLTTAALSVPVMFILARSYGEVGAALGALFRDGMLVTGAVVAALHAGIIKKEG